jgi:hypothetical protein
MGTSDNHGVRETLVPRGDATLISQYKIKMPGYGKRMEKYAPEPTNEVQDVEQRFVMPALPKLSLVQLTILAMILYYAWSVRKMNKAVVSTAMLAIGLLHMYDHMYRVKRGDERLFFFPEAKKEGYCSMCQK